MKQERNAGELSYFGTALLAFLRESHPQLSHDKELIRTRSEAAAETYERAVREGNTVAQAMELSNAVLYDGLRFSRYDTIFEVVSEWFPEVLPKQRTAFCLKMLPVCGAVFDKYRPGDDNYESNPAYQNLLSELAGTIQLNIDEHGL